jgi:hypothetical protein
LTFKYIIIQANFLRKSKELPEIHGNNWKIKETTGNSGYIENGEGELLLWILYKLKQDHAWYIVISN